MESTCKWILAHACVNVGVEMYLMPYKRLSRQHKDTDLPEARATAFSLCVLWLTINDALLHIGCAEICMYMPFNAWRDFLHLPSACHVIRVWKRQFWQPRHQFGQSRATNFGHLTLSPDTAWWCKMCVFYVILMFFLFHHSLYIINAEKSLLPPHTTSLSWPWSSSPSEPGSSNL